MASIIAQHYRDNYEALSHEFIIISMALDTVEKEMPFKLTHENSDTPTHEFMSLARAAYQRAYAAGRATTDSESIGAVAEAVLIARKRILDAMARAEVAAR